MDYSCEYNPNVVCDVKVCEHCGWNPEVAKARLDAILKKMEEDHEREKNASTTDY